MFEDDDVDIDVNDEFLNIVFEKEEIQNNNQHSITERSRTNVELNNQTAIKNYSINANDQSVFNEPFHAQHHSPSSSSENHFLDFNLVNIRQQRGACSSRNFTSGWNQSFLDQSDVNQGQTPGTTSFGNKENKRKASPPPSRTKRERRFPGPAGLLPDRKSLRGTPLKSDYLPEVESPSASTPDELCSQGRLSGSVLEEGPWQSLVSDLGPHAAVLDSVNVASVKRKAAARCFVGRKVPFLAAVLHHLDVSSADPCVILRDTTGEIHGTLHREVWQQFATELVVGSVLVIRNVGLLSTGLSSRRHYLNITANNLATIYSANPDKPQKRELYSFTSHDYERTVEQWKSLVVPPRTLGSPSSPLFNTSLSSISSSSPVTSPSPLDNVQPRFSGPPNRGIRPSTSQNIQQRGNLPGTSPCPRANPPPRPMGKILFPSCSNSNSLKQIQTTNGNTIPSGTSRTCNGYGNKANLSMNTFDNSFMSHSLQTPNGRNAQNPQIAKGSVPNLNFDPVTLKTKTNGAVPYPNTFGNQSTSRNEFGDNTKNQFGNSPRIILSQSSQLTVEEQSVVENVFDGIDVDSLFDDDF